MARVHVTLSGFLVVIMSHTTKRSAKGRQAERPAEIGKSGWKDIVRRVRSDAKRDHLDVVAAGVAFYAFLSLFPALAAGVLLYG